METTIVWTLLVSPSPSESAENVLLEGESMSESVKQLIVGSDDSWSDQQEFISRGLRSREDARQTGLIYPSDKVISELETTLAARKRVNFK